MKVEVEFQESDSYLLCTIIVCATLIFLVMGITKCSNDNNAHDKEMRKIQETQRSK